MNFTFNPLQEAFREFFFFLFIANLRQKEEAFVGEETKEKQNASSGLPALSSSEFIKYLFFGLWWGR